tara:strand:+ start:1339 stop:1611 length:273 start_codon:yes stop_codon:yes gene_type:complete
VIIIENELIAVAFLKVNPKNPYTIGIAIPPPPIPAILASAMNIEKATVPAISSGSNGIKQLPSHPFPASASVQVSLELKLSVYPLTFSMM